MENMISFINRKVSSITFNESLSSIVRDKIKELPKKPYAGDHYNLVDLCNPSKLYYDRTSSPTEKSPELQKKLEWGTKLHEITQNWLKSFPDFVIAEGTIDGIWVDIPKVRGRIDCKIGDSIFEIKTKEELPIDVNDVLTKYPQDVEQLSFYSVVHPSHDKINYLLFIKDSQPFEMKVFKLEIKDLNKIKAILEKRIKLLDEALETKNPIPLGRCRYYGSECQYEKSKKCNCEKVEPLSTEQLEKCIELSLDIEMTKKLEELRKKYHSSNSFFTTLDIISPRKFGLEKEWTAEKDKQESQNYLHNLIKKIPTNLSYEQRIKIVESVQEKRLYIPYKWINVRSSNLDDSIPYIMKANMSLNVQTRPNEYFLTELGLIISNYKKTRGIIFIIYPKINNFIQVFEVTYKQPEEILSRIKEIINELEKKNPDLFNLPSCPRFMNDEGKCPLMSECNSRVGFGCIV